MGFITNSLFYYRTTKYKLQLNNIKTLTHFETIFYATSSFREVKNKSVSTKAQDKVATMVYNTNNTEIQGVIFDMDGTLTIPVLDFKILRKRLQVPDHIDILGYGETIKDIQAQMKYYSAIEQFEDEGNRHLKLQPNIYRLFEYLKTHDISTALITRNNRKAVDAFVSRFLDGDKTNMFKNEDDIFSMIITRDFTPVKPHPAAAHFVCNQWDIPTNSVLFVGDELQDIQCGNSAGNMTALKLKATNENIKPHADICVDDLNELIGFIEHLKKVNDNLN